ncbi:hypothetical protein H310_08698 [Aphanomyces invadans]|uniref:Uncharacterized protein n=1 Tax=Aphanomyces invadans TaxID=157072 RepID=A0A024TWN1_9STRA|nr:hypothetical protein H310_08698 [Aphanomyces invadans]ETV98575.1 hypothetical protein H310_08698 [Aphanomyces invadans]|eukprot:XP_008872772.1 hypothetical protein H310_08698 [Aphanomyces invadans]
MNNVLASIAQEDDLNGVAWNDAHGLLLGAYGDFKEVRSGLGALNSLVTRAKALNPSSDSVEVAPVVRIVTTKRNVVVQEQKDGTVLAVSTPKAR